ncbi:membrane or secreted protein [Albibacterium indicum]|uniref:membrane or secreted protein n=1 Tax=Albibacterium indicum TaxID=2292082 RepID=UPI0013003F3B|nr:membrane or secreted protein [Pedobacter indicus]
MENYMNYLRNSLALVLVLVGAGTYAQSAAAIGGAWEMKDGDKTSVLIFQDNYFTESIFKSNEYVKSFGGPFKVNGSELEINLEFDSENNARVGSKLNGKIAIDGDQLTITQEGKTKTWKKTDHGDAPLAGVWHITERMQDGNLVAIHQSGTRKTLKVLTEDRFQWFAIDAGTKQFSGTGGGTYTFENGKYTENIEFFSRDNSRVGASLSFDGELKGGKWHHSGLSSKGDKIYEVWSRVE